MLCLKQRLRASLSSRSLHRKEWWSSWMGSPASGWRAKSQQRPSRMPSVDALSAIRSGQRFPHSWIEPFDLKNAIPAYEDVIEQALQERGA